MSRTAVHLLKVATAMLEAMGITETTRSERHNAALALGVAMRLLEHHQFGPAMREDALAHLDAFSGGALESIQAELCASFVRPLPPPVPEGARPPVTAAGDTTAPPADVPDTITGADAPESAAAGEDEYRRPTEAEIIAAATRASSNGASTVA